MSSVNGIIPTERPALFQRGEFTFSNGDEGDWKCECDAFTDTDWDWVAWQIERHYGFSEVHGVPSRRGNRDNAEEIAKRLRAKAAANPGNINSLIVDDVYRTGGSLRDFRDELVLRPNGGGKRYMGCVVYARRPIAEGDRWINPIWRFWE